LGNVINLGFRDNLRMRKCLMCEKKILIEGLIFCSLACAMEYKRIFEVDDDFQKIFKKTKDHRLHRKVF